VALDARQVLLCLVVRDAAQDQIVRNAFPQLQRFYRCNLFYIQAQFSIST
jgi:hypothetical protein